MFQGVNRSWVITYHIKGTPTTKYCSLAPVYEKHLTTEPKHLVSNEQQTRERLFEIILSNRCDFKECSEELLALWKRYQP